jgi:hypothetical protein
LFRSGLDQSWDLMWHGCGTHAVVLTKVRCSGSLSRQSTGSPCVLDQAAGIRAAPMRSLRAAIASARTAWLRAQTLRRFRPLRLAFDSLVELAAFSRQAAKKLRGFLVGAVEENRFSVSKSFPVLIGVVQDPAQSTVAYSGE